MHQFATDCIKLRVVGVNGSTLFRWTRKGFFPQKHAAGGWSEVTGGVAALESTLARYGVWLGKLRHTTRDGRKVEVEGRLSLMSHQNGRWLVLEVNRDITDRKAAESARRRIETQLAQLRAMIDSRPRD